MDPLFTAFQMVFEPKTVMVMLASSAFGLFVGAVPGLTATMATALLVPVTFFMPPIMAIAAIVTATAMAIFSGDIPGCLLRMPGTPASAAYCDEAYAMTRKGHAETALGAGLVFSAIGGLFGTAVLIVSAPGLADFALRFSSFEYFWLVLLGLSCAIVITAEQPLKGVVSLLLGLMVASVGLGNPAGFPRFTFGSTELMGGIGLIPMMIGVLYMKNMNPGPTLFTQNPQNIYAVYLLFILANVLMVPFGWACIKAAKQILRVPRNVLMPIILLFCVVGTFAINNTVFDV